MNQKTQPFPRYGIGQTVQYEGEEWVVERLSYYHFPGWLYCMHRVNDTWSIKCAWEWELDLENQPPTPTMKGVRMAAIHSADTEKLDIPRNEYAGLIWARPGKQALFVPAWRKQGETEDDWRYYPRNGWRWPWELWFVTFPDWRGVCDFFDSRGTYEYAYR